MSGPLPSLARGRAVATILGSVLLLAALVSPALAGAPDSDGDKLRDTYEARWGISDPHDWDSDDDGVIDSAEDSDGDRLSDLGEQRFGLRPHDRDSDDDGTADGQEDADGDGRSNALEQDQRPVPRGLRPSLAAAAEDIWVHQPECGAHGGLTSPRRCWFGAADSAVTLAVVGDSKATMHMPAFILAAKQLGWRVVTLLKGRCSPVLHTTTRHDFEFDRGQSCDAWRRNVLDWLGRTRPDLIVYAHSDDYALLDERGRVISGDRKLDAWRQGVRATVSALPVASEVLWLGDAPNNEGNPVRCLKDRRDDISACVTRREGLAQREVEVALREGVAAAGGRFRTLHDQVCTYDPCPLVQGDILIFRDEGHLTTTFTRRLAPSMRQVLSEVLPAAP
jgi:hypothetical protein